jgi:hypothetical protein
MTDDRQPTTDNSIARVRLAPWAVLILIAAVVLVFFSPILPAYFLADDYNYVGHLLVNARQYIQGEQLDEWFIAFSAQGLQNPELSVFFRPVVQWLWLTDFIAWGADAFGYHLTNIILHALNSFLVYLLALRVLRHRGGGIAAGLLFALHPIHSESVSWIADRTDVLSTFFYFSGALFFVLYRQRDKRWFGALSLIAFAFAIGTKENTVALPLILLAYDVLFKTRPYSKVVRAQVPYWLVLVGYVALRFLLLGQFGRNTGGGFLSFGAELFAQFYALSLAQPFLADMDTLLLLAFIALAVTMLVVYRARAAVWFGALWIGISLLPATSAAYVAPRLAYAPSAGWVIALAAIFVQPLARQTKFSRALGAALLAIFLFVYGWGLAGRVDNWAAAGAVARAVPAETQRLHPTLAPYSRLYYTGVPELLRNIHIYNQNFATALQIAYRDPTLRAFRVDQFPILTDDLERAHLFEYRRRAITERADLVRALQTRQRCLAKQSVGIVWDFARDSSGWEAWNQLETFEAREGALTMRATGDDPNLGSPVMDVPAFALGDIEIEMRVRADVSKVQAAIFWMVAGQNEFTPLQRKTFAAQADGAFHIYRVNIVQDGMFALEDRITRLRLDPTESPGEIALKAIRIYSACAELIGVDCLCR